MVNSITKRTNRHPCELIVCVYVLYSCVRFCLYVCVWLCLCVNACLCCEYVYAYVCVYVYLCMYICRYRQCVPIFCMLSLDRRSSSEASSPPVSPALSPDAKQQSARTPSPHRTILPPPCQTTTSMNWRRIGAPPVFSFHDLVLPFLFGNFYWSSVLWAFWQNLILQPFQFSLKCRPSLAFSPSSPAATKTL